MSDPGESLVVPTGWEPVADLCRDIARRLDAFVGSVVERILAEISHYTEGPVSRGELRGSVFENLDMTLRGLAQHRGPTLRELAIRRELGHQRAEQGMAIDAVLQAYHVGFRELWNELVALAAHSGGDTPELLLSAVTTTWTWVQQITDAVADAHRKTTSARQAFAVGLRHRLLDLLLWGDLEGSEARSLVASLDFEPSGAFVAAYVLPSTHDLPATRLQLELDGIQGTRQLGVRRDAYVLLCQGPAPGDLAAETARIDRHALLGVGLLRPELSGARASLIDAEEAFSLACRRGASQFYGDSWAEAAVLRDIDRLRPLLAEAERVARDHPALARAVRCYANSGFSLAAAARELYVHPNTMSYRLDRWTELTGWSPRSWSGLLNSIAALDASQTERELGGL